MPKKSNERGPVGARVAAQVADLRHQQRMSKTALAATLEHVGRPMSLDVLTAIETGTRSVDVDDLVCLAVALDASVFRLLFGPPTEGDIAITPTWSTSDTEARLWAQGQEYLGGNSDQARRVRELVAQLHDQVTGEAGRGER